jgi:hypothetical protein
MSTRRCGADYSYSPDPPAAAIPSIPGRLLHGGLHEHSWFLAMSLTGRAASPRRLSSQLPHARESRRTPWRARTSSFSRRGGGRSPHPMTRARHGAAVGDAILAAVAAEAPVIVANSLRSRVGLAIGSSPPSSAPVAARTTSPAACTAPDGAGCKRLSLADRRRPHAEHRPLLSRVVRDQL